MKNHLASTFALAALSLGAFESVSHAASKEECVESHGRGQDQRERGQLARARQSFLTCAQGSCPSLVQGDCARFSEELAHLVPTVSFGARDANAADVPNTTVYVDDAVLTTRLDDGKSYELDPGKHVVRYLHDGKETTLRVVLNQGEKGRLLLATFPGDPEKRASLGSPLPVRPGEKSSAVPFVVAGIGGAALVTGAVLFGLGMRNVPSSCSLATHECSGGAPADLESAQNGMKLANVGLGVGISGAALLVSGLVWHLVEPKGERREAQGFKPWLTF